MGGCVGDVPKGLGLKDHAFPNEVLRLVHAHAQGTGERGWVGGWEGETYQKALL